MKVTKFKDVTSLGVFERELRKLGRRFRTLEADLEVLIDTQLYLLHKCGIDNGGTVMISGLGETKHKIFKTKKFACQALKGKGARTGLRLIHAYNEQEDTIELIEIYFKGDKANEDKNRILSNYAID